MIRRALIYPLLCLGLLGGVSSLVMASDPPPDDPYAPTYGETETFTATYLVTPLPGGKRFQPALLKREDGETWIRSYRPIPEEYRFHDREVVVTGRPYWPSHMVQHVSGVHFELDTIALAPGQKPNPTTDRMPAPPTVISKAGLTARDGAWAMLKGTLTSVSHDEAEARISAELTLADGAVVHLGPLGRASVRAREWAPLKGKAVTVLARAMPLEGGWRVHGGMHLCAGDAPRCGLDLGERRKAGKKRKPR